MSQTHGHDNVQYELKPRDFSWRLLVNNCLEKRVRCDNSKCRKSCRYLDQAARLTVKATSQFFDLMLRKKPNPDNVEMEFALQVLWGNKKLDEFTHRFIVSTRWIRSIYWVCETIIHQRKETKFKITNTTNRIHQNFYFPTPKTKNAALWNTFSVNQRHKIKFPQEVENDT